jgi:hypothetical protein
LGHASTSVVQSKRSYEQMMNDTMSTSFQQQMRIFYSFSFDVSVPLTNTLHGMPSLLHLSSTENELTNENVYYAEFNNGLSVPDCADILISNDNDDPTVPIIEKCPFQRNAICLPPDIAFQIHLLSKMNNHRGNDTNMFNEVLQCVKAHALHYRVDFTTLQILSRKQLVQILTKRYQLDFLKPTLHSVSLSDGSVATVPIFDVKAQTLLSSMILCKCGKKILHQIMISSQEKRSRPALSLMKSTQVLFGRWLDSNTVVMI